MLLIGFPFSFQLVFLPFELLFDRPAAPTTEPHAQKDAEEGERQNDARLQFPPQGHHTA